MAVHNGIGMAVNGASTVGAWTYEDTAAANAYTASNLSGGTGRVAGVKDWSASATQYAHTPFALPGASVSLTLYDAVQTISGTALVDQVTIDCDIEGGGIITSQVQMSGSGASTKGAGSASDATIPNPPSAIGCKFQLDGSDVANGRKWQLILRSANSRYSDTSTAGWTGRTAGSKDAQITLDANVNNLADVPVLNQDYAINLFVDATNKWIVSKAKCTRFSTRVDSNTQQVTGYTATFELNGTTGAALGSITNPAGTAWWP
jgi:hypothetical protein